MAANAQVLEPEAHLADEIAEFTWDPEGFAFFNFPWGEGELEGLEGPRKFQREVLASIREHLCNPETRFQPLRIAIASGHGIGKTALFSIIADWAVSTCEDCRVNVTANTSKQLETKISPELGKWFRRGLNADWFNVATFSIKVAGPNEKSWRVDMLPWNLDNPQAIAGQHNIKKRIVIIFDEASEIPDIIWETTEGALTDKDTEIIWIVCGQRTRSSGRFVDCFGKFAHRWKTWEIDARTVEGTNQEEFQRWIEDYGIDSDVVKVRVLGQAPSASELQFIDSDRIRGAQERQVVVGTDEPLVAGADFAWGGSDFNVIRFRRGRDARSIAPVRIPGEKTRNPDVLLLKLAEVLSADYGNGAKIHTMFVDSAGIAGNVVPRLRQMGFGNVIEVNFAADSPDPKYANMRAFMWGKGKDWLLTGAIPQATAVRGGDLLAADLGAPDARPDKQQRVILEDKKEIKKRIGRSTDDGDAFALTFSFPVSAPTTKPKPARYPKPVSAWG